MKRDGRPEHQKIAALYRALIMSEDLAPGEQLSSVAQLMERHGVAVHTVQRALDVLRDEGFTETRRGIGVFVRDRALVVTEAIEYLSLPNWLLDVGEVEPPADVAKVFGLERDSTRSQKAGPIRKRRRSAAAACPAAAATAADGGAATGRHPAEAHGG